MEVIYSVYLSEKTQRFCDNQTKKARKKIDFVIDKVKLGLFGDWFKKLVNSDDIWEFVIDYQGIFYRILAFWDTSNKNNPEILCTHGFKKKSNRTPKKEIKKAERIKKLYFEE